MRKRKINTKKEILKVASDLFSQRGYFGVSMSDIAQDVGVGKSALYYHFESKEILLKELMETSCKNLRLKLKRSVKSSTTPFDVVFNIVKTLLDYRIIHPEISLLTSLSLSSDDREPVVQFIIDLRVELLKLIRDLIGGLDFIRRKGRRSAHVFSSSILGFVLSPLVTKDTSSKDLSHQLMSFLN